jgi:ribosome biogenesis SPOUT family RNA methylase Rps3
MFLNIILDTEFAAAIDTQNFQKINSQLTSLKDSNKAYLVYSGSFYSVYAKLKLHGINYLISQKPINCNNIIVLDDSGGSPTTPTDLCKL